MYVCVSNHFPSTELIESVQAKTKDQFPKFILRIANKLECLVKNWLSSVAFDFRAVNVGIVWEKLKSHLCRWVLSIPPSCDIQSTHYVNKQMWIVKIIEKRKLHLTRFSLSKLHRGEVALTRVRKWGQFPTGGTGRNIFVTAHLNWTQIEAALIGREDRFRLSAFHSWVAAVTDFVSSPVSTGEGAHKYCNNRTDYSTNYRR